MTPLRTPDTRAPRAARRTLLLPVLLYGTGLLLLAAAIALAVSIGEIRIPFTTTLAAIGNALGISDVPLDRIHESIVRDYRLSRALVAACCGAGLALCGAILQALLRNPLAEPYVLGISAGASTGAVAVMVLGLGGGAVSLSLGAFVGSLGAFAAVVALSSGAASRPNRIILAGVASSQLFNALTAWIVSTSASAEQVRGIMFWLLGNLGGVRWPEVQLALAVVAVAFVTCLACARALDAFTFGQDAAAALGIPVRGVRLLLFTVTALLTAAMVSMVGAIGFVGLVIPHAARLVVGPTHVRLLPTALLTGAIFMVLADLVSRLVVPGQSLPIGVVTALVGAPVFAIILYRARPPM
ncbi:FecCD family ABC transporter permease [Kushneria aurantia]|uniref:FecCD family ABC transporter permease n=1 Tax=Kushneria aurantia TaxID=504092 RepID=A0ABV6G2D5_9GAMM|nr:iron ABC transporter permease [Kushneria aurantia]